MNQPKPEQEPSMEEILASIRRIISEDGDEGGTPEPQAEAVAAEDDVLELTQVVPPPVVADSEPEADAAPEPEPEPEPAPEPEPLAMTEPPVPEPDPEPLVAPEPDPEPALDDALDFAEPEPDDLSSAPPEMEEALAQHPAEDDSSLVADSTALMASAAMSKLTESSSGSSSDAGGAMPIGDKTIEALVRELMRPMIKDWLDRNLPGIVEQVVEREVSRVAERLHNN